MNRANAIKDKNDIKRMSEWFKNYSKKYYTIFLIAISSGLRISDVLGLNISDVKDRDYVEIHEKKTGKYKRFPLNKMVQNAIKSYLIDREKRLIESVTFSEYLYMVSPWNTTKNSRHV